MSTPYRLLLVAALTALGFLAIWKGPAKWFGDDLHWTRVLTVVVALFVGFTIATRRGVPLGTRILMAIGTACVAVAAWLYVPSPAGRTLDQAIQESSAISLGLVNAKTNELDIVQSLKARADALAVDYPKLGAHSQHIADVWVRGAADWYRKKCDSLPPGNVANAKTLQTRVRQFDEAFPGHVGNLVERLDERVQRTATFDSAFATAKQKAEKLTQSNRAEEAFGVARTFAVEWFAEAQFLKREPEVIAFRDDFRDRAERVGPFVPPAEIAPAPRSRETAPPPREAMR